MSDLVADAEDLLEKLSDVANPDIRELRDRVEQSVAEMKKNLRRQLKAGTDELQDVTATAVEFLRENPWVAVAAGTAVLVTIVVGLIATSGDRRR